jgi:hypothetical protein
MILLSILIYVEFIIGVGIDAFLGFSFLFIFFSLNNAVMKACDYEKRTII